MRIALAQINSLLGDFEYNSKKIISYTLRAKEKKCELVVFPEAALFGYHPFDLLERKSVVKKQEAFISRIQKAIPKGIIVIFGAITVNPQKKGKPYFNSAVILQKEKKAIFCHKQLLPTGDVFDEARFIESGEVKNNVVDINGRKTLVTICEDIWAWPDSKGLSQYKKNPLCEIEKKVDLVVNLSASPFYPLKINKRKELVQKTAKHFRAPMIYVNMVGAQDEIVFDGASFAVHRSGKLLAQSMMFEEDLNVIDLERSEGGFRKQKISIAEEIRQAIVQGIRDFCFKTKIQQVHLGLSGGIDSAVVACLAVDALGAGNVTGIAMPGPFNQPMSLSLANDLAKNLSIQFLQIDIVKTYKSFVEQLEEVFQIKDFSVVHENIQARIRGNILMAFANTKNSLLLATGNKSELSCGYSTLYGDMCGGLFPIGDLTKQQVYQIAGLYNLETETIPQQIITRAPSAELRPNQKDQDTLPEYKLLDESVIKIIENCRDVKSDTDRWLIEALLKTEFKRWQAAPILKVSKHSFGRGRRYPIAHQTKEG